MKFYSNLLLLVALALTVTSCQFSEDIYINEDGSGKMEFKFDGSALMAMGGDAMKEKNEENIDTTIVFKDFLYEKRDSIAKLSAEEQAKLKKLENFTMRMEMNAEKKKMVFDLTTEFKKISELKDAFKSFNETSKMMEGDKKKVTEDDNPFSALGGDGTSDTSYEYNDGMFKRIVKITNPEKHKRVVDSLGEMEMMLSSSVYKINYHFPRKIKSTTAENAVYSSDKKTITVQYGFIDYIKDPEALNIEVVLED